MHYKKVIKKLFLVLILSSFLAVGVEGVVMAQEVGADVHIKVEASADSREVAEESGQITGDATWRNYSGTEYSGGETIVANPGDTIYIRTKIWNTSGYYTADNVTGTSQITNASYVTTALVDASPDGTSLYDEPIAFNPYFFVGDGNGAIAETYIGGSESDDGIYNYGTNCEGQLTSITLADTFPPGQTIITAQATITDYENREIFGGMIERFGIAYAQGVDRASMVRITVGEAAAATATPTATITATPATAVLETVITTPTPTATVATLPATGSDNRNKTLFYISAGLLFALSSVVIGSLVYGIKKGA